MGPVHWGRRPRGSGLTREAWFSTRADSMGDGSSFAEAGDRTLQALGRAESPRLCRPRRALEGEVLGAPGRPQALSSPGKGLQATLPGSNLPQELGRPLSRWARLPWVWSAGPRPRADLDAEVAPVPSVVPARRKGCQTQGSWPHCAGGGRAGTRSPALPRSHARDMSGGLETVPPKGPAERVWVLVSR